MIPLNGILLSTSFFNTPISDQEFPYAIRKKNTRCSRSFAFVCGIRKNRTATIESKQNCRKKKRKIGHGSRCNLRIALHGRTNDRRSTRPVCKVWSCTGTRALTGQPDKGYLTFSGTFRSSVNRIKIMKKWMWKQHFSVPLNWKVKDIITQRLLRIVFFFFFLLLFILSE